MQNELGQIRSREQLIAALGGGLRVKYLFFFGHKPKREGAVDHSCFSQWFPAAFELDGERYPTAEHFMMAEKARLFGDRGIEAQILSSTDPHHAKQLGRRVSGYDDECWKQHRVEAVVRGNVAKFSQNPELSAYLDTTGERVLVEAAPRDCIWGSGSEQPIQNR